MNETIQFDYYYGIEAEQFSFYRVPRLLIKDERFKGLIFDWSIVTQINLGSKKNKSREIPSTYFPCPVPSGLPYRLHCVPMNIKRCGFKVFWRRNFSARST